MSLSALLNLVEWDGLSKAEKIKIGREVERKFLADRRFRPISSDDDSDDNDDEASTNGDIGSPVVFHGLETFSCGPEHQHDICTFRYLDGDGQESTSTTMLLIPGGQEIPLGFHLTTGQKLVETWSSASEYNSKYVGEWGFPPLEDMLSDQLRCSRIETIPPFLVDQKASTIEVASEEELESRLNGWSLSTSDEWEWAYRGGSTKIFPWGDSMESHAASAFGFHFPTSTYNTEICEDMISKRGGDGGVCECGGYTGLPWQLIHACAYESTSAGETEGWHFRKVIRLPGI